MNMNMNRFIIMVINVNMTKNMNMNMNMHMDKDMDKDTDRLLAFKMPERRTIRYPVSPVPEWKKLNMPELLRYRTKPMQSGIFLVQYRTELVDAGMPMPALIF